MAGAAAHMDPERRGLLLRDRTFVDRRAVPEHEAAAPTFVDREVAANRVRMLPAEPGEAEIVARPEPVARERSDRHGVRGNLPLHVERAASPDLAVAQLA